MSKNGLIDTKSASELALGGVLGFAIFWLTSHHKSPVNKRLPSKKYKSFNYSPHIGISRKEKDYHIHHWAIFSALYLPFILLRRKGFKLNLLHGFFLGTILQGLTYKDRFKFVNPMTDFVRDEVIELEPVLQPQEKK